MANNIKSSKGVISQKQIVTKHRCKICGSLMRQDEIGVEVVYRHEHVPGTPHREKIMKHVKNCNVVK